MRRSRNNDWNEEINLWPAFTDLMSNAFMILILFLLLSILKSVLAQTSLESTIDDLTRSEDEVVQLARENAELRAKAARVDQLERGVAVWRARAKRSTDRQKSLEQQVRSLQVQISAAPKPPDTPPIIVIKDQGNYRFDSGSAEIPSAMKDYIRQQIVPAIESNAKDYEINVVELIGHTDGQPNLGGSNIDQTIGNVVNKNSSISQLRPGSNADLGLMRALAVVQLLREIQAKEGRLKGLQFRAYSAAQLILPNGQIAPISLKDDQTRRRIEIRFTRLGRVTNVQ
ncbi:hypothetical protein BJP36_01505 [Moorena producens JHB]|uniref:Flagellar motor protein n=1 Tax=Moorena producens (strain JHB) TaxID=1454205 RepID=A0A1D9FU00_MOOP1|nr:hypothetical protein [Moorena producens]AOY78763.1 hypothetical protein BJP36_01505 [Moorena producens JHB]